MIAIRILFFSTCVGAGLAGWTHAQDQLPSQYQKLRRFDVFIGQWIGELDLPGGPDDTQVVANAKWSSNKSYVVIEYSMITAKQRTHIGTQRFGLNSETGDVHCWSFWPDRQSAGAVSFQGNFIIVESKGKQLNGNTTSSRIHYEVFGGILTIHIADTKNESTQPTIKISLERRPERRRNS